MKEKAKQTMTKLYFIHHLRTLPSPLLEFQLSLSNKMTDQLLTGPIRKKGVFCSFTP